MLDFGRIPVRHWGVYIFLAIFICGLLHDAQAHAHAPGVGGGLELPIEIEVSVELIHRTRSKRSISHSAGRSRPDYEYQLRVSRSSSPTQLPLEEDEHGFLEDLDLHLKPTESVFGPNFHYTELRRDPHGNEVWNKLYPSQAEIESIENKLYVDPSTNTVVRLEASRGQVELDGVVNGARIRRRRRRDTDSKSGTKNDGTHFLQFLTGSKIINLEPTTDPNVKDYVIFPDIEKLGPRAGPDDGKWIGIEPELVFVLDPLVSAAIGGERADKLEYVAITVNGINNQFSLTNKTLGIKCELVGLVDITDLDAWGHGDIISYRAAGLPALTPKSVLDANGRRLFYAYDSKEFLFRYAAFLQKFAEQIGPHDLAPLLTGVTFINETVAGIAYITGACRLNVHYRGKRVNFASLLAKDIGAFYSGIRYMAHEIGHSLGSPHDGEEREELSVGTIPSTEACPFNDGYLMSYLTNVSTNQFRFSNCSLRAIRTYIRTETAGCLSPTNKTGKATPYRTDLEAGDRISAEDICRKLPELHGQGVAVSVSPDEQCRHTYCLGIRLFHLAFHQENAPGYNAPCGYNKIKGKCRNGYCVGHGPAVPDVDTLCKILWQDVNALFDQSALNLAEICNSPVIPCLVHNMTIDNETKGVEWVSVPASWALQVMPGTHCGNDNICFNQKCMKLDEIRDPNKECILGTGKQEAVQTNGASSHSDCSPSIKCTYGSEFEYVKKASTNFCTREDGSDGVCSEGDCVPMKEHVGPRTIQDACAYVTKSYESKPVTVSDNQLDLLCSKLKCEKANGEYVMDSGNTIDGTICGPLRQCSNGKCVSSENSVSSLQMPKSLVRTILIYLTSYFACRL